MKLLFIAIVVVVLICQSTVSEAARYARSTSREKCEQNWTHEQCEAYAKDKAAKKNTCVRYGVANNEIVWHHCGVRICQDSQGNKYRAMLEDGTKMYPDCCPKCH